MHIWGNGRLYSGNWKNGKQHGLGIAKNSEGTVKRGLWEDGKHLKWFNDSDVYQIKIKKFDYSQFFEKEENK